ncbi:hypothetical protein IQ265_13695 [Nodosilinea sp. LEGE 06152]|uniref:hypothetical protein n=1 Tax=Nodosilinea sp. LEGE 06152 TaxID=2777966 RepID=UPI00187FD62C|nr:hypothetical protein [Nodosilinea sp. LEGE 06152]MBE9157869.1 hypothetical protein [Nodosilinea sp. LEGE 06152]
MEEWQNIAIAEVNELCYLLREGPSFTKADLCDRLRGLLEYIELDPAQDPHIEDDLMHLTTRDDLINHIGIYCTHLEFERLRRIAKLAYQESLNQQRAIALQAQADPGWLTEDDTPTAADPGDGIGTEPECVVYAPGQE